MVDIAVYLVLEYKILGQWNLLDWAWGECQLRSWCCCLFVVLYQYLGSGGSFSFTCIILLACPFPLSLSLVSISSHARLWWFVHSQGLCGNIELLSLQLVGHAWKVGIILKIFHFGVRSLRTYILFASWNFKAAFMWILSVWALAILVANSFM